MFVGVISNSFVGKPGNVGMRTKHILQGLGTRRVEHYCFARGFEVGVTGNCESMGVYGSIPRLLNGIRIYLCPTFDQRKWDVSLLEWRVLKAFPTLVARAAGAAQKVIFLQEQSPKLIRQFQRAGFKVVLDVAIAPASYDARLLKLIPDCGLTFSPATLDREMQAFLSADKIIVPSPFVRDEVEALGISRQKISVIPFGVDIPTRAAEGFKETQQHPGVDFCFAGNISARKGVRYLIEAFDDPRFHGDRLHLCGRLFPEIRSQLALRGNPNNILLPGFVDTHSYFKTCDVYVLPSLLEGSSKSIYEAMSAGLPVITTYESGSIVRNEVDGYIVPLADVETLRARMIDLKNDINLRRRMGAAARSYVQTYAWQRYAQEVLHTLGVE